MADYRGYEYMNEESINYLLKCSVCTKPFIDPVTTKCDGEPHTFCRYCIEERLRSESACPVCNQNLHIQDLRAITDGIIKGMLDQLSVRCLVCEQTGLKRGNFDVHKNELCPKIDTICPSFDMRCPWIGSRDQLDQHVNICVFNSLKPLITALQNENQELKSRIEQQLENQMKQVNERLQLLELMTFTPLECKGRPCFKCKKCSDWYYDGKVWMRRNGYTCTDYVVDRNSGVPVAKRSIADAGSVIDRHVGSFFGGGDIICQCKK